MGIERDPLSSERQRMVAGQVRARGVRDPAVLAAMEAVPRHIFVPEPIRSSAYEDRPLPIGNGQTISQPYIVGVMTELLAVRPTDRILEIGSGSGYQAAIIARIAREVISIERIPSVAADARRNLAAAAISNVRVIEGDGTVGYSQAAPFDGIIITAASPDVPSPLPAQLEDGGRLVAPIGPRGVQELVRIIRKGDRFERTYHGAVCFVPLIGVHGWEA